jgi:hypothetical protein
LDTEEAHNRASPVDNMWVEIELKAKSILHR